MATASLKVGGKAPEITLLSDQGKKVSLMDFRGKKVVLYFYPKDDTPGCTKEACGLRDDFSAFRDLKATVIGVSYDSIESHKKFIKKHNLPFLLASDQDKSLSKAFGVSGILFPDRSTFIIGRNQTILYANPSVNPRTHSQEIRDALAKLATTGDIK